MRSFEYVNRKGVTYYIHTRPGRAGTTHYTLKRSQAGALDELPDGYEVVENVNGQASIRRVRGRKITAREEAAVESSLVERGLDAYRCEVKDAQITIFEPDRDPQELADELSPFHLVPGGIGDRLKAMLTARFGAAAVEQYVREHQERSRVAFASTVRYAPVMRFRLVDGKNRLFEVARMTYSGEGGWHALETLPLGTAVKRYVRHIGQDSFFDLI
jgi:hypothetical protein